MNPDRSVLVLTPGLSGSSVLTGLLGRAGYWVGEDTATAGYETYEDSRLIELNNAILSEAGFTWHDTTDLPAPTIDRIRAVADTLDPTPFVEFLEAYEEHRPWIWKDPRLAYTIHFWKQYLPLDSCQFVVMNRKPRQAWIGLLRKNRLIIAERDLRRIHSAHVRSARAFLEENGLNYCELDFDVLVSEPDRCLQVLNEYLGTSLSHADMTSVYRGPLGRKRWGARDYVLAKLRYGVGIARSQKLRFPRTHERA